MLGSAPFHAGTRACMDLVSRGFLEPIPGEYRGTAGGVGESEMKPGFSGVQGRGWQRRLSPLTHASSESTVRLGGFVFPVFFCAYAFFKVFTHTHTRVFMFILRPLILCLSSFKHFIVEII